MRIAYISYEFPPDSCHGGIATYVGQIAAIMAARGHEVEVFASSPKGSRNEILSGVVVHWIGELDREDFGIVAGHAFADRHGQLAFDVLEGPEYNADARKAKQLVPEIPLVVKMHTPSLLIGRINRPSGLFHYARHWGRLIKSLVRWIAGKSPPPRIWFSPQVLQKAKELDILERRHALEADVVAPPCRDLCDWAVNKWQVPAARVHISPYPYVPTEELLAIPSGGSGAVVGFVGRVEKRKGVEDLCQAIPLVLKSRPETIFRFVGAVTHRPGTRIGYDEWIKDKLGEHAGSVEFLGKVPLASIPAAYEEFTLAVFPSIWENFPNVCLEAMSAGRAIVASSAGGMSEMLEGGRCGRLVPPNSPRVLADAIIGYLDDSELRKSHGEMARARLIEVYNCNIVGEAVEKLYFEAQRGSASASA